MSQHRRKWGAAALLLVAALSASGLVLPTLLLPDPSTAGRGAARRWLALGDLAAQPRSVQIALVDRLQYTIGPEQLLGSDSAPAVPRGWWSKLWAERAARNAQLLERVWFETRAAQYAACPPQQRGEFLRTQVRDLSAWSRVLSGAFAGSSEGDAAASGWKRFFADVRRWMDEAAPAQRELQAKAVHDGVLCWLATADVAQLAPAAQQQLAESLVTQLATSSTTPQNPSARAAHPRAGRPALSAAEQQQLHDNVLSLGRAWLLGQAQQFAEVQPGARATFLDARLEQLQRLNLGDYVASGHSVAAVPRSSSWLTLANQLPAMSQGLNEPQQQQFQALIAQLQQRFLLRSLKRAWPFSSALADEQPTGDK